MWKKVVQLLGVVMMIASGNASAQTGDIPFHELSVGNVNVRVVSLVQKDLNASILLPGTAQQKKAVADAYPDGAIHNVLNVLLLRAPGVAALVDTGFDWTDAQMDAVADALAAMCTPEAMEKKYGLKDAAPLLFAVGDGNHSLATAKQCYENLKKVTPEDQWADLPARYALVEVVNNHDDALQFEPIHRVLFGVEPEQVLEAMKAAYPGAHEGEGEGHTIAYTYAGHTGTITVPNPRMQLAVGTLQTFLDAYLKEHGGEVDYIHGDEVTDELGSKSGNIGFKLPAMGKEQLFKTVMADGVLPRKTFSMGHAQDKRYYVEARKIK